MNPHTDDTTGAGRLGGFAIRRAVATDADALAAFAEHTFTDTYARFNDPENLRQHIASTFVPARQAEELADPGLITLLACWDDELAAFAQVRRSTAPPCVTGGHPVELYRLYLDRCWHGCGLSQRMMAEVCAAAHVFGGQTLWLKVWERNVRAIAFYRKSGFEDVGTADFLLGADRQIDRVLVRCLTDEASTN